MSLKISQQHINDAKREFYLYLEKFKKYGRPACGTVEYQLMFDAADRIMKFGDLMSSEEKSKISQEIAGLFSLPDTAQSNLQRIHPSDNGHLQRELRDITVMENLERWHFPMVNDFRRNQKFKEAIRKTLNIMKKDGLNDSIILDVGTGSGILALYASEGASDEGLNHKVIACEALPVMVDIATRVFEVNRCDIRLVPNLSTHLTPDDLFHGKADLLVTETFDAGAFGEHVLETLDHAWKYLLNKSGRVLPSKVELWFGFVEAEDIDNKSYVQSSSLGNISIENVLIQSVEGDMSPYNSERLSELPNEVVFLSEPTSIFTVNLESEEEVEHYLRRGKKFRQNIQITNSGHVSCAAVWFKLFLDRRETVVIHTHPDSGHCWEQAIFPVVPISKVEKGDFVDVEFLLKGHLQLVDAKINNLKRIQPSKRIILPERYIELLNNKSYTCSSLPDAILKQSMWPNSLRILDATFSSLHSLQALKQCENCDLFVALLENEEKTRIDFVCELMTQNRIDAKRVNCGSLPTKSNFDVVLFDPILHNGRLDPKVWKNLSPWIKSQQNHPKLFPCEISIKCVLVEADNLVIHSKMLEDPSHTKFKISEVFNGYAISHLTDVSLDSTVHLTSPCTVHTVNLRILDDSVATKKFTLVATKSGTLNGLIYWFEMHYPTDITVSSLKLFRQCAFLQEPQEVFVGQNISVEFKMQRHISTVLIGKNYQGFDEKPSLNVWKTTTTFDIVTDLFTRQRMLQSIIYKRGQPLLVLDQLKLPHDHTYIEVRNCQEGWKVINNMNVRGAPAIGLTGLLSMAVEMTLQNGLIDFSSKSKITEFVHGQMDYLVTSRPTGVNLRREADSIKGFATTQLNDDSVNEKSMLEAVLNQCEQSFAADVEYNKAMGDFGANDILKKCSADEGVSVLTHCNTGSLATAGYGTALGVIRSLHSKDKLKMAYFTETRPFNQGSRLTAYELMFEKIPSTLLCDSAASFLMSSKKVSAVIVGADRIAANGDTANKIGTLQLAVAAFHYKIPFYVAAPTTTIDLLTKSGQDIQIENRSADEITLCKCNMKTHIPPKDVRCWNPSFDVTPADLITGGIVTEHGVIYPPVDCEENLKILKLS